MIKIFVAIISFIISLIAASLIWFSNPGFDVIISNELLQQGTINERGFHINYQLYRASNLDPPAATISNLGYATSARTPKHILYWAEKSWLNSTRYRRIALMDANDNINKINVGNSLGAIGIKYDVNIGDKYIVIWNGRSESISSFFIHFE